MSNHTKGPWHLGTPGAAYDNSHLCEVMTEYSTTSDGATAGCHDLICRTWSPNYAASSVRLSREECYANARLIAAAPDLLAALQQIERTLREHGAASALFCEDVARAAIAKATA